MFKIVEFSHYLIKEYLNRLKKNNLIFVDATCGAGNDTLFMANELKNIGVVISYDIQEEAIKKAKKLLTDNDLNNVVFKLKSHEFIDEIPDVVIYNFGYLPNTDKTITTIPSVSLTSIKKMVSLIDLNNDLFIILVLYPGHTVGMIESKIIDDYCKGLSSKDYLVCKYQNYNRCTSPFILTICKNKKSH